MTSIEKELFLYIFIAWSLIGIILAIGAYYDYCKIRDRLLNKDKVVALDDGVKHD